LNSEAVPEQQTFPFDQPNFLGIAVALSLHTKADLVSRLLFISMTSLGYQDYIYMST